MSSCIEQLPAEYFILSHENDILLQYDKDAINGLVQAMKDKQIDSIDFKHNKHNGASRDKITDSLYIMLFDPNNPLIFGVQPRLWRKESAIKFFKANPDKTYRSSEDMDVQIYMKLNQKTYELYSTKSIKSWYFGVDRVAPEYMFMHITHDNKFSPKSTPNRYRVVVDPIVQKELDAVQQKYIDVPGQKRAQAVVDL
jgi:hypothetical protein